jgi:integration host factor subunit beta
LSARRSSTRAPATVRIFLDRQRQLSTAMTKSELIEALALRQKHLAANDVELAVKSVLEQMSHSLSSGERIEIRGFGSFSLHYRPPRMGRNPKTGDSVALPGKHVPHFKPGKELRERVNGKDVIATQRPPVEPATA